MPTWELILALAITTGIPLLFVFIIYTRNLYATSSIDAVVMCFLWGLVSFFLALVLHNLLADAFSLNRMSLIRYLAPVSEEILKALILLILVRRTDFTYFVDGAIYGFTIGIGFATVENYSYILDLDTTFLSVAIGRLLSCILVHATASALVGVTLGLARFERKVVRRLSYVMGGLFIAVLVHGGFNNLITRLRVGTPVLYMYAAAVGVSGAFLILWIIQRGLDEEQAWIEEMLGMADQVTEGEAKVVLRLAEAGVILAPLVERFGQEKATQIGRILVLQARLGILRKTLEKLPDEQLRRDAEAQRDAIKQRMVEARRAVGAYPMLYLRHIFPEKNRSVWRRLETITADRDDTSGISTAHMLTDLPAPERRLMRLMLRQRGGASRAELGDVVSKLPEDRRLTSDQVDTALDNLIKKGLLVRIEEVPVRYRVELRRKAGLTLTEDIWAMLDDYLLTPSTGEADVWDVLRSRLDEQARAASSPSSENLWSVMAQRLTN
jgi:RsiW-degrading membrane proteinase PrsW (M82 family)